MSPTRIRCRGGDGGVRWRRRRGQRGGGQRSSATRSTWRLKVGEKGAGEGG